MCCQAEALCAYAVEAVFDIASLGINIGLISSATQLLNESLYDGVLVDKDYEMWVLSLAVSSGTATPFLSAANLYEHVPVRKQLPH